MPDTDRRTVRRPARPRRRHELSASRGYVTMPNVAPYRVTIDHHERESIMRELFAFIRAAVDLQLYKLKVRTDEAFTTYRNAVDLQLYKLKVRIDEAFTTYRDPFDVELPELDVDDDAPTFDEVEAFLARTGKVVEVTNLRPEQVEQYLTDPVAGLGIELQQWQRDLLGLYYGEQVQL